MIRRPPRSTLVERRRQRQMCIRDRHMQDAAVLDQHATKVVTASLLLEELDSLLPHGSIYGHQNTPIDTSKSAQGVLDLDIVKPYVSQIHPMKTTLREQIENLLLCGLRNLSPSLLGAALQAACSLGLLNTVMQNLLNDLTDVLTDRCLLYTSDAADDAPRV